MKQPHHIFFLILLVLTFLISCSSINSFDDEFEEIVEQPVKASTSKDYISSSTKSHQTPKQDYKHSHKSTLPQPQQQVVKTEKTAPKAITKAPETILSDYRLGKGDVISIKVFGEEDFSMETALSKEGRISYPFLGELKLSGLTVSQVERKIASGLRAGYLKNPKVTITVLEYRQIFVNGEVKTPGGYAFKPGMTVNKAISLAGGFTETASRDEIFLIRDGDKSATEKEVGLYNFIAPGDIIIVKEYKKIFVNGEVKNPGSYEYIRGMTVNKVISLGGGFTETASRDEIFLIRDGDKSATEKKVGLFTLVNPGDIIIVKEYKKFFVNGEVKNPGSYEYIPNLTVEKAISIAGGFGEFASPRWSKIFVIRDTDKQGRNIRVNLKSPVFPGDIITIEETTF
jgi:polysaccharide export outer membrane protein